MATTTVSAPEAQPSLSAFARIIGVFFNPKPTFADIAKRPGWVAPMAILLLISIGLSVTLAQRVNWVEVSKEQIAKNKFASRQIDQLSEDQKDRAYEQAAGRSKVIRYIRGFIGWPLLLVLLTGVYLVAFKLIGGGRINFAAAFAITTFAHLPVALKELIAIPVTLLKDPASIDPENFLASNPAAIIGNDLPAWQMVPLVFLDVFGLWALVLVAVGFSASDPKKLPFGKSLGLAIGVSVAFLLFFTMIAWVFS
jgi:Yip1-like protein